MNDERNILELLLIMLLSTFSWSLALCLATILGWEFIEQFLGATPIRMSILAGVILASMSAKSNQRTHLLSGIVFPMLLAVGEAFLFLVRYFVPHFLN